MKICPKCKKYKEFVDFYKDKSRPDGIQTYCKSCHSEYHKQYYSKNLEQHKKLAKKSYLKHREKRLEYNKEYRKKNKHTDNFKYRKRLTEVKRKFNLTEKEYLNLISKNQCAICKTKDPGRKYFDIDHCHKTGKIRGILCTNCNNGLGRFKDNIEFLKEAILYLSKGKT